MSGSILIVDDEAAARFALSKAFEGLYATAAAASVEEARAKLRESAPDVVLLDYHMPGEDGIALLRELQGAEGPAVVMITAHGSERIAVDAMKNGAFDYLPKPYDLEELRLVVARAIEHQMLRREVADLRARVAGEGQFGRMVGDSPMMRSVFLAAERIAETDLAVLILGESGVGKDLLAQEIHERSSRRRNRFVALNCAALPETLVESELFGYEKGAFTGAAAARPGKFELANRGTLFLDEVGDMTAATQAKILRAAESGEIERLGGRAPMQVDVRILAATNQDLPAAIQAGRFRQDLYFRLAGMTLYLPPLRQRKEDIPLLVERFWRDLTAKYQREGPRLTGAAMAALTAAEWPGNVRQLRAAVERLFVLSRGPEVTPEELRMATDTGPEPAIAPYLAAADFREARRLFEIEYLTRKLREFGGNVTRAAAAIGLERQSLQEKIKQLGISR